MSNDKYGKEALTRVEVLRSRINVDVPSISRNRYYGSNSDGVNVDVTYISKHISQTDSFGLKLEYGNYYIDDRISDLHPFKLNISAYINGVVYPMYFNNGDPEKLMSLGSTVITDELPIVLRKGDEIYIRSHVLQEPGQKHPRGLTLVSTSNEGWVAGDQTANTKMITTTPGQYFGYSPMALYSKPSPNAQIKTLGIVGSSSSIGVGRGNYPWKNEPAGDIGYLQIGALEAGWSYCTAGVNGQTADSFQSDKAAKSRLAMLKNCDMVAVQYVSNDLANTDFNFTRIRDNMLKIHDRFWKMGIPTFQLTVNPRTTSTDGWKTLENQTPLNSNFAPGPDSTRGQFNRWTMDNTDGIIGIDVAPGWESSPESGLWKVSTQTTGDGIHPNREGHEGYAMTAVRDFLLAR